MSTVASLAASSSDALQKLLQPVAARQTSPGTDAATPAPSADGATPPPAKPVHHGGGHAGHRFGSDTLSALISSQTDEASDPTAATSGAAKAAQTLVGVEDANGDGALSADEVTSALTRSGSRLGADAVKTAVASLDANGDGQISRAELTQAIQSFLTTQAGAGATAAATSADASAGGSRVSLAA